MQRSTLEQLQQQLQSANAETRRQAAEQLGQLKDERAVEALIEALTKEARNWPGNWQVKDTVASALITCGDAQVVPALVEVLQHNQDVFVQELAAETLMRIEGVPLEVLVLVLQAGGGVVGMVARGHAAAVLGQMGDARAVEPLIAALQRNDKWEVLCTVAQALGKIGGAQAIESLGRVLNDNRKEYVVQREAAWSLGKIGDERAVEQLVEALKGTDRDVRRTVAEVLESLGWRPANDL